jgi:hypothetical protein
MGEPIEPVAGMRLGPWGKNDLRVGSWLQISSGKAFADAQLMEKS